MVSEITTWVDEGINNPNELRVTPCGGCGERSVIFGHRDTSRPAPALNEADLLGLRVRLALLGFDLAGGSTTWRRSVNWWNG